MRVTSLGMIRDGGTIEVSTDFGVFFVDRRIGSQTEGTVYAAYPRDATVPPVTDSKVLRQVTMALAQYAYSLQAASGKY